MASPSDGSDHGSLSDEGSVEGCHDPSTTTDDLLGGNIEARLEAVLKMSDHLVHMDATSDAEQLSSYSPTYSSEYETEVEKSPPPTKVKKVKLVRPTKKKETQNKTGSTKFTPSGGPTQPQPSGGPTKSNPSGSPTDLGPSEAPT